MTSADQSFPLAVPAAALAVAVAASVGAYVLNLRARRRDHAMSRHPARGGVGRPRPTEQPSGRFGAGRISARGGT